VPSFGGREEPGSIGSPTAEQFLDIEPVVGHDPPLREQRYLKERQGREARTPRKGQRMWGGDADNRTDRPWRVRHSRPRRHAAPVVPDHHTVGESQTLDHSGDIECGRLRVVTSRGLVAGPVAAQVHGGRTESGRVKRRQLVAPRPPELSKSMQKHDERTLGTELLADRDMEANPVGRDVAMPPWPIKQDVAYPGACHVRGSGVPAGRRRR